jgi:predicted AAA+ superfamily ATPase
MLAIEVKGSSRVEPRDLRSMMAFIEEYAPKKALLICNEREEHVQGQIRIMPWQRFLEDLWERKIIR